MATPGYPSASNTYVPDHGATGGLVVGFSRNAKDFPVNRYIEIFPVKRNVGFYMSYTSRAAARIMTSDDAEHLWSDGAAAPDGFGQMDTFQFLTYATSRRCYAFMVGEMAEEQAEWPLIAIESEGRAQQAMTARTMLVHAALSGASWGSNTAAVNGGILASGQNWTNGYIGAPSGSQGPNIRKSLQYAAKQINLYTIGMVRPKDLTLVVNPTTAQAMAASPEIQDYLKQSPFALAQVRGEAPWLNSEWDLPDRLYGYNIVVEDAVRVSSKPNAASDSLAYVMPDDKAYLIAGPGQLVGIAGRKSYSTVQGFFYKDELTVETMYDQPNRRTQGRVVTNYQMVVASTYTGFYFSSGITT